MLKTHRTWSIRFRRKLHAKLALAHPRFAHLLPETVPLDIYKTAHTRQHDTLIVCLPGISDIAQDFERFGFLAQIHEKGIAVDIALVDAHFGYYRRGTLSQRLTEDVIQPAKTAGYRSIWLAGNSLGGYGALHYALQHPHTLTGLLLLAPYLGPHQLIHTIAQEGGAQTWQPNPNYSQHGQSLWQGIKNLPSDELSSLTVLLGFGTRDKFATANQLLADQLPSKNVFTEISGGHNWKTWSKLWCRMLAQHPSMF